MTVGARYFKNQGVLSRFSSLLVSSADKPEYTASVTVGARRGGTAAPAGAGAPECRSRAGSGWIWQGRKRSRRSGSGSAQSQSMMMAHGGMLRLDKKPEDYTPPGLTKRA